MKSLTDCRQCIQLENFEDSEIIDYIVVYSNVSSIISKIIIVKFQPL